MLAIPHHTAYVPGVRSKNWSVHDEQISPFAEIFSVHGCSESDEEWIGLRHNRNMGPGVSGGTIEDALDRGIRLSDLPLEEFQQADPELDATVYDVLGVEKAVASMTSEGSTGPEQVRKQVALWKERLDTE